MNQFIICIPGLNHSKTQTSGMYMSVWSEKTNHWGVLTFD